MAFNYPGNAPRGRPVMITKTTRTTTTNPGAPSFAAGRNGSRIPVAPSRTQSGCGGGGPCGSQQRGAMPQASRTVVVKTSTRRFEEPAGMGASRIPRVPPAPRKPPPVPRAPAARPPRAAPSQPASSMGQLRTVRTITSKSSIRDGKKVETKTTITREYPDADLPEGQYFRAMKQAPRSEEDRYKYSSPDDLRSRMDERMPQQLKQYRNLPTRGVPQVTAAAPARAPPGRIAQPSPLATYKEVSPLEAKVEQKLYEAAAHHPRIVVEAAGSKVSAVRPPVVMTPQGPVEGLQQIITEKTLERTPEVERTNRRMVGIERGARGGVEKVEMDTQRWEPIKISQRKGDSPLREVISVTSSVTMMPGGRKEISNTITREITKELKTGLSPAQVSQLVSEEATDIDRAMKLPPPKLQVLAAETYPLKKREHDTMLTMATVSELEKTVVPQDPSADKEQEDAQPEMLAAMMHTEETGIQMGAPPSQMYGYLFPDVKAPEVVDVRSVAPAPLQDVMVPAQLPESFYDAVTSQDVEKALEMAQQVAGPKPSSNVFTVKTLDCGHPVRNVAKRGPPMRRLSREPLISEEMPPWGAEGLQPIINLVGATPASPMRSLIADMPATEEDATRIDYVLQMEAPTHVSRVQLRGSQKPPWFPGYVVAFPEIPSLTKVVRYPAPVLQTAWKSVQPKFYPDESFMTA